MKEIPNSNYSISEEGIVYNSKKRAIARNINDGGATVKITFEGVRRSFPIWKLMKLAYFPKIKTDEVFVVIDGDITNCNLSNFKIVKIDCVGKRIKGHSSYIVNKCGEIFSLKYGRLQKMSTYYAKNGYEMIKLCEKNSAESKLVHRIVAESFIPNIEGKSEIDHIDRNIKNNKADNLRWCSRKENMSYCFEAKSPIRNFKECFLIGENGFKKKFKSKAECCRYAKERLNCKYHSLMKYGENNGYKIVETLND